LTFFWLMNPRILHHKVVMILCASIISESEVSITVLCLLCSSHYTAVKIKNCLKSMSVIKVATTKIQAPVIHFPSHLSATFNLLHSCTDQELFEKHLCNQGSHCEKYGWFPLHTGSHHLQPSNQGDTGKSLKNGLDILRYAERHLSGWSDIEQKNKIKPIVLSVIELH